MSIEQVLIPVGIAIAHAVGEVSAHRKAGTYKIKTIVKRQHLLQKAIEQDVCDVNELNHQHYHTQGSEIKICFQQDEKGVFEAVFDKSVDEHDAMEFISNLHTEYKYLIQQETYQKLIQQAGEHGLELEAEEIQKDRSILLTFN